ncbi:hypothetical protein ACIQ9Q_30950 [Streptomyces sp. NPDC094438]|uniref:hypothetical protein n=1 Tax=Streptomyces sp. NPDC094438 TaxID=3366061 RepID=UPI00382B244B
MFKNPLRGVSVLTLALVSVVVPAVASPASASSHIHFYAFENPTRPRKTTVIDGVDGYATNSEHQTGECKNVRIGRDFFNESGRTVQVFRVANCAGSPASSSPTGNNWPTDQGSSRSSSFADLAVHPTSS